MTALNNQSQNSLTDIPQPDRACQTSPSVVCGVETNSSGRNRVLLDRGVFLFSLDFELAWGTRGRGNAANMPPFLDGTRHAVLGLLELFKEYNISGTWATVGALLMGSANTRTKKHRWIASNEFNDIPAGDSITHPHWFAEDLVQAIRRCDVKQDIGCHTLTHGFLDPSPAGRDTFRMELERSVQLFEEFGLERPTSFIFPKAKMGHFDILAEAGFRSFRGPENKWFESLPGVRLPAAMRLLDAKMAGCPKTDAPELHEAGLWMIPSSQFYSPFYNVGQHVSVAQRVKKAIKGLHQACDSRGVYHLWTHPFNLGVQTDELLTGMRDIFKEAASLRKEGKLEVLSMESLSKQAEQQLFETS